MFILDGRRGGGEGTKSCECQVTPKEVCNLKGLICKTEFEFSTSKSQQSWQFVECFQKNTNLKTLTLTIFNEGDKRGARKVPNFQYTQFWRSFG